ncbi:TPA: glycosyltransferase [Vibrio parahaemolyticus]|nr:glycosyltransferase [Vibrio parahaemolyticus]ELA9389849.1 glycosyltransferase [Vibrio parahaemolyticus]HCG8652519.1 glycosyltransferase [Vibrio parahaemolyticus]
MKRLELIRKASKLYLDGMYSEAKEIYQELLKDNPDIDSYQYNIFMCSKKLGNDVNAFGLVNNECKIKDPVELIIDEDIDVVFLHADKSQLSPEKQLEKFLFYIAPLGKAINNIHIFSDEFDLAYFNLFSSSLSELKSRSIIRGSSEFDRSFVESLNSKCIYSYIYNDKSIPDDSVFNKSDLQMLSKKSGNIWRVHDSVQHHGSFLLKSLSDRFDSHKYQKQFKNKLIELRNRNDNRKCYVFGTGPSLKYSYCLPDVLSNIVIACNSIVKNPTMLEFLKPEIVCATDPIFHSGYGSYGEDFRKHLIESMFKYDFFLVVPHRDIHIYLHYLPKELHARIGCYNFEPNVEIINTDLIENQISAPKPNVLTNIMLPIAATISNEIYIGGCDGKKSSSSYFWEHDKSSQLNNKMSSIQDEFKGFFDINYDSYYDEHCKTLGAQLDYLSENGYNIKAVTPSYIPALETRLDISSTISNLQSKVVTSIIMPARNMADTIIPSVESVLVSGDFSGESYSLIIIDEGSSDNTEEILRKKYPHQIESGKISIIKTIGLGVACARNIGIALANSDYVGFLDADDFISSDSIKERVELIKYTDENIVGAFSKTKLVEYDSKELLSVANDFNKRGLRYGFERIHGPAHISSILYKSKAIEGQTFPPGVAFGEDWLFLSRVLRTGGELLFCENSYSTYSIYRESVTKKSPEQHVISLYGILNTIYGIDDGVEGTDAKYYLGLGSVNKSSIPSYNKKISELTVRLIACFYANLKTNALYNQLVSMNEAVDWGQVNECIGKEGAHMASTLKREVKRFSGSDIDAKAFKLYLSQAKVSRFVPNFTKLL